MALRFLMKLQRQISALTFTIQSVCLATPIRHFLNRCA
jgi:hypothetical protein